MTHFNHIQRYRLHSAFLIDRYIAYQVMTLNFVLLVLVLISQQSQIVGLMGAIIILSSLVIYAFQRPDRALYTLFGIKFVYDGLWFIRVPGIEQIGMLHLFIVPMIVVVFSKNTKPHNANSKLFIILFSILLFWFIGAMLANYTPIKLDVIVRHAGPIIGMLIGARFIAGKNELKRVALVVCLGTFIPACVIVVQLGLSKFAGIDVLFATYGSIRGIRFSGLYYDAGTMGIVSIASFLTGFYLLIADQVRGRMKYMVYSALSLNVGAVLIGQTRSALGTLVVMLVLFAVTSFKKSVTLLVGLGVAGIYLGAQFTDKIFERSNKDVVSGLSLSFNELMYSGNSRTLLTGRVGLWQDIWERVTQSSGIQQWFGLGVSSNAHSSYFYLLLMVGYGGVLLYLLIHVLMLFRFLSAKYEMYVKIIGVGILFSLLVMGLALNVTVYTSFQWILYMMLGGLLNFTKSKSRNDI